MQDHELVRMFDREINRAFRSGLTMGILIAAACFIVGFYLGVVIFEI